MKSFHDFLLIRLQSDLPGRNAHRKMAPSPLQSQIQQRLYEPINDNFRNSSVLIPILNWKEEAEILFTLRVQNINHGGQISFPGGGREGNETIVETALREAQEEIGLQKKNLEIAGVLSPLYVNHSDNMITPVVVFLNEEQKFTPNPNEVEEIFTVPFSTLAGESHLTDEEWKLKGVSFKVPFWDIHRVPLWGATAMILNELIQLYKEFLQQMEN